MVADFSQLHHDIKQGFGLEFLVVVLLKNAFVSDLVVEDLLPLWIISRQLGKLSI